MNLNVGDTQLIIADAAKCGLLRNQLAYVLATAWHETGGKMKPIAESLNYSVSGLINTFSRARITKADCERYGRRDGKAANQVAIANCVYGGEWGKKNLGNNKQGDGWLYRGRGYVQITGRSNYEKFGIASNPDEALISKVSARILVEGMSKGSFTGRKLTDYITLQKSDFIEARRIINGTDKADLIAGYAKQYDSMLKSAGYGEVSESVPPIKSPEVEGSASDLVTIIVKLIKFIASLIRYK